MKRKLAVVFGLAVALLMPQTAFAWNETGHKVVARIAWDNLQPQTRDKVMALLQQAPEDSGIGLLFFYDSRELAYKQRDYFAMLATWADIIRDKNAPLRQAKYSHSAWHYTNLFWKEVNGAPVDVTDLPSSPENVVERLAFLQKALSDPTTTPADRAVYLVWVMHLIGDIQQPLHCSARVTDTETKGDLGGNLFLLSPADPQGPHKTLHAFWDDILNNTYQRDTQDCDQAFISMLVKKIEKEHPAKDLAARIKPGQFADWAQEGLNASKTIVYPPTLKRNEWPSKQYLKQADKYSEEAIALGGYRLAQVLNQVFAAQ